VAFASRERWAALQVKDKSKQYVHRMLRANAIHGRRFEVGQQVLVSRDFDRNTSSRRTKFSVVFDLVATVEAVNVGGESSMYMLKTTTGESLVAHVRRLKLRTGVAIQPTQPQEDNAAAASGAQCGAQEAELAP
jgi:hypothetical protein